MNADDGKLASLETTGDKEYAPLEQEGGTPRGGAQGSRSSQVCRGEADILQFTSAIYYLDEGGEDEGELAIDVMRLGPMTGTVSCNYTTLDGSGKAGISYIPTSGTLTLGPDQARATFKVHAVKNATWAPTMEFMVKLTDPDNCQLGAYLKLCRVKVLNDDAFPTNKYNKEVKDGEEIPVGFALWWQYMRLNYAQPGMAWRTWLVILVDQVKNLYLFFKLWFNVYLVDVVLNHHEDVSDKLLIPGNRQSTIVVMGVIWILPNILLHLWDIAQLFIAVKGKSVAFLQEGLFREYLNFSEKSRTEVLPSDMIVCVSADCGDVAGSYCTAMGMLTGLVKVGIFVNFIAHHNPSALWVMGVFPTITICFSMCRLSKQMFVSGEVGDAEIRMMSLVNEVCQKYRLVADYFQRPYMNTVFTDRTAVLRSKQRPEKLVFMNNGYFPSFLGFLFVGVYIATASNQVVSEEISLGTYLATISVFKDVADVFSGIYGDFVSLTKSFDPLGGLTELYNKKTDLHQNKHIARFNRGESKNERSRLIEEKKNNPNSKAATSLFVTDLMQIRLQNVTLNYNTENDVPAVLEDVSITAEQGQLIAVTGAHGSGRATLLKIFGKVLFPTAGEIIVPTHLRSVHVGKEPMLMKMSLWENLAFGLPKASHIDNSSEERRAKDILHHFGADPLKEQLAKELDKMKPTEEEDEEEPSDAWQWKLTSLDRGIVHLARAFIMNPEILVLQRPLSNFSAVRAMKVLNGVFKEFVDQKGLAMDAAGKDARRPRTLFFVPESEEQAHAADIIWELEVKDKSVSKSTMTVKTHEDPKHCKIEH